MCRCLSNHIAIAFDNAEIHTYTHLADFLIGLLKQRETYSTRTHHFQFSCCLFLSLEANRFERLIVINLFHLWLNSFLFSIKRQRATSFVTAAAAANTAKVSSGSSGGGNDGGNDGGSITRVRFLYLRPRVLLLLPSPSLFRDTVHVPKIRIFVNLTEIKRILQLCIRFEHYTHTATNEWTTILLDIFCETKKQKLSTPWCIWQ